MPDSKILAQERYGFDLSVDVEVNETIETILSHKSCRKYKTDPISADLIKVLLACSQSAPSKSNLQQYSIIVVTDRKIKSQIANLVPSMDWLSKAPILFIFLGDLRRIRRLVKIRGYEYQNNNSDTFMNAAVDAALAMQALITSAESVGLGTCPISYLRNRIEELSELLLLPSGVFPICGLTVGYRAEAGKTSIRLPQEVVVHYNEYNDDGLEEEILKYDDRDHKKSPILPNKQRHVDKYGVLAKCTWSENVSRQLSVAERENFNDYLKNKDIIIS